MICPLCRNASAAIIYAAGNTPIFQNKVYRTREEAARAARAPVELAACARCGYVFNRRFDASLMSYDGDYQNEQAHSPTFDGYLDLIVDLLEAKGFAHEKVVEVGCGKGTFLKKLWARGFDAVGFDTAYEGDDPRVHREYFSDRHAHLAVDLIVLRHTLEHVASPLAFLQQLARLTPLHTRIYIEVPAFEWIIAKRAFWDVFYEHCNYFTLRSLASMFAAAESGRLFGDQYMYVLADLRSLHDVADAGPRVEAEALSALQDELDRYRRFVREHSGLLVWGAGAKGSTFANLTDPGAEHVVALVDINARKAGAFLAGTTHPIIAPEQIAATRAREILVMNENYRDEIGRHLDALGLDDVVLHILGA